MNYANSHGWSNEVYAYQIHKNNDRLWSAVIKRQALTDPEGALASYRDASSLKRLTGEAQAELEKVLKPHIDLFNAQNAYNAVTGQATAQQIAGEAQRQGVDPSTALTIWSAEGGVTNPAAQNPDSSATGISQHTAGTWGDLGGTDQNRTDGKKQVELGVALTKQNSAALTKDLGRRPQPWEVYLAHQQGIGGATALLHADPNSNAAEVVGNPEAITLNGGTPDMSAGEFINTIKGYVDRHSMMYAANGVPTAQNLKENYEAGLQAVTDLARQEHPGDPAAEQRYRSHYIQQAGQQLHAENMTNQANWNILNAALNGPNAIKSEQDLMTNPRLVDAYNAILKTDPSAYRVVNNAINANASAVWDPPATVQTSRLYDNLNGMKDTDRPRFSDLNLMSYYGGMPAAQLNSLRDAQDRIRKNDPTEAAKHTDLISSISAVKDLTIQAAASIESPFYKMDLTSPFPPEQQKWNGFVSKFGQAPNDWQQNNNNKIPTDTQKREIAQGILFPNAAPASPLPLAATTPAVASPPGISRRRDRDAAPGAVPDSPETGAIKNQPPEDTNTSSNNNADTDVLDSNGKPDQITKAEGDVGATPEEVNFWVKEAQRAARIWDNEHRPPVKHVHDKPDGTVIYYTGDQKELLAPFEANWQDVYDAGKADGGDPFKAGVAIGHFGTFDFQRKVDENTNRAYFFHQYENASNYAVGVYMNGAGFSLKWTIIYAKAYAHSLSSNADAPDPSIWWTRGWKDADKGKLPISPGDRISNVIASLR